MKESKNKKRGCFEITISWLVQENVHDRSERDRKFHRRILEQVFGLGQFESHLDQPSLLTHSNSTCLLCSSICRVKTELKTSHTPFLFSFLVFSLFYFFFFHF